MIGECLQEDLVLDVDKINDDDDLFIVGVDSINLVSLIIAIEEEFGVEFDTELIEMEKFQTINDISNTIRNLI